MSCNHSVLQFSWGFILFSAGLCSSRMLSASGEVMPRRGKAAQPKPQNCSGFWHTGCDLGAGCCRVSALTLLSLQDASEGFVFLASIPAGEGCNTRSAEWGGEEKMA